MKIYRAIFHPNYIVEVADLMTGHYGIIVIVKDGQVYLNNTALRYFADGTSVPWNPNLNFKGLNYMQVTPQVMARLEERVHDYAALEWLKSL